jgi:hypothetical protein
MSPGEAKKIIVYQVENTGMSIAKHQNPAGIDIEIQNTIGEQRREQEKKTMQGAYVYIHQTTRRIFCKKHQKQH